MKMNTTELVANCPRCGANQITFDVQAAHLRGLQYNWQRIYEAFCICRRCNGSTVFYLVQDKYEASETIKREGLAGLNGTINNYFREEGYIGLKNMVVVNPPEHMPADIEAAFREGATCMAVGCYNAAAAMFRLCLDFATKDLMPEEDVPGLTSKIRRSLGLRMEWLFNNRLLPEALKDLSDCVREDGNDGAHDGTLEKADAEDLQDFTVELLERLYTEPARLKEAEIRRKARRGK